MPIPQRPHLLGRWLASALARLPAASLPGLAVMMLAVLAASPTRAMAESWNMKQILQPPGLPRPPLPGDRGGDRGGDDTSRARERQEQQQREARERNDREQRWHNERQERWNDDRRWDSRGDSRWDHRWDGRWDARPDPWVVRPAPPVYVVPPGPPPRRYVYPRPRYGVVVPVLPWAATTLVVGTATYWYCDGVYYRRLPADAGYQVVDTPTELNGGRIVDERLYVYPRNGQSARQQASDEYECHRWAVEQTGFDPTNENSWSTQSLDQRDDYRRAQTACLDGRGYTVK